MRFTTRISLQFVIVAFCVSAASAQESGNQGYTRDAGNQNYGRPNPVSTTRLAGDLLPFDPKDSQPTPYVEAYVLMNVKADTFVAVFGMAQEGPTAAESNRKVDKLVNDVTAAALGLGVKREDVYVDFITQTPVYDYSVSGRTAREALTGFQTKKTIAIRYDSYGLRLSMEAS